MAEFTKLEQYKDQRANYPYPMEAEQDPKLKKEAEYALMQGRAMLADYQTNVFEIAATPGETKRTFRERHEYAAGTYPNSKLKDRVIGTGKGKKTRDGRHITKMNISWDTFPVISKMLDVMLEKNMKQDYDLDSLCVDDDSIQAKEADKAMLKYFISEDFKTLQKLTGYKPGLKIDPAAIGLVTETDVDLYFECGAYPFQREIASVAACNKTKLVSKYKVIQDGSFRDLITHALSGWKFEIDKTTATVKMRKVQIYNPETGACSVVLPYSESNDFENLSKCGEIRTITIKEARTEFPHLNAQQLIYMANCYSYLNPEYSSLIASAMGYGGNLWDASIDPINRCKILLFDYQWLGCDIEDYVKNEGKGIYKPVNFGYELTSDRKRKGDKHIQKKVIKKWAAKWVIGTDIVMHDIAEDIIWYGPDGDRCPGLDYFFTKTGSISLIERCISIQDDIDLANIKLRNALSSAIPAPRMVVQQGLLDNVFMNGIKVQPEANMATLRELGYLIVNAVDDDGKPIFTNQKLVDFLPIGVVEDINVFTGQIIAGINNLREVLGIAQGADGSTPQKYDGAKKTELSQASSNAALFPTFNCFQYLFEAGFNHAVKMWQIIAKDRKIKLNYSPLGQKNLKVLALDPEFTNADINIMLTLGATDQERQQMLTDIAQLKALGIQTGFQQGITTSEYIYLTETLKGGNIKQAMWVMAKIEQKKIAAQKAIDERNQQQNAADQKNSAAQAEINKRGTAVVSETQKRITIMLQEAEKRKTAIVTGMLKTYESETDPTPTGLYEKMMGDANNEIAMIAAQDQQQQQGGPQDEPEQPGAPDNEMQEQQQVA